MKSQTSHPICSIIVLLIDRVAYAHHDEILVIFPFVYGYTMLLFQRILCGDLIHGRNFEMAGLLCDKFNFHVKSSFLFIYQVFPNDELTTVLFVHESISWVLVMTVAYYLRCLSGLGVIQQGSCVHIISVFMLSSIKGQCWSMTKVSACGSGVGLLLKGKTFPSAAHFEITT